jgi:hypothetical protein
MTNYLYIDNPDSGYAFGFDVAYKEVDNDQKRAQVNLNDLGNNAWAYAPALAKFVITNDTIGFEVQDSIPCDTCETFIRGVAAEKTLKVYPNPATNMLHIAGVKSLKSISVYNTAGKELLFYTKPEADIDVSCLKEGMYIINMLFMDGSRKSDKLIVK